MQRQSSLSWTITFLMLAAFPSTGTAQGGGRSGPPVGVLGPFEETGISLFLNHRGPGGDFDKTGVTTRVAPTPAGVPAQTEPFMLIGPTAPGGAVVVDVLISWNFLLDGAPPATDTISVNATAITGVLVGSGTPGLCWGKDGGASYLVSLGGVGPVVLGGVNTIAGATNKALGADPDAFGEGLTILVLYEVPAAPVRNVDIYAGYASNQSGPLFGTATVLLPFTNAYDGGDLHFFISTLDGQGFGDEFFIDGVLASGLVTGTVAAGNAWQGLLNTPPGPPPATEWLYDHGNDDISTFASTPAARITVETVLIEDPFGDCVAHSFAAVSFSSDEIIPAEESWSLVFLVLLFVTGMGILLHRFRAGRGFSAAA